MGAPLATDSGVLIHCNHLGASQFDQTQWPHECKVGLQLFWCTDNFEHVSVLRHVHRVDDARAELFRHAPRLGAACFVARKLDQRKLALNHQLHSLSTAADRHHAGSA